MFALVGKMQKTTRKLFLSVGVTVFGILALPQIAGATLAQRNEGRAACDPAQGPICLKPWTKLVTIGPGIPAVSFRFDGQIGVLDKIAPVEFGLNLQQRTYFGDGDAGETRVVFWRASLGITFGKSPDQGGASFGAYVMPWGLQVNNFGIGVAVGYNTVGKLQSKLENWSVLLPVSYTVQF